MRDRRSLEERVGAGRGGTAPPRERSWRSAIVDYFIPLLERYDERRELGTLMADADVQGTGISRENALEYLRRSYDSYKWLFRAAKFADTADKVSSVISAPIETALLSAGAAPGFVANLAEESIELLLKAPALYLLARNPESRSRVGGLLKREAFTFVAPAFGDLYEAVLNHYVRAAYEVIQESAKGAILADYRPGGGRPPILAPPGSPPHRRIVVPPRRG